MNQDIQPLNGGRASIVLPGGRSIGFYLSEQYTTVNKLTPRDTEWVVGGRPIYDRLPSASQRYKLNFELDGNAAYPYIPIGEGYTGPFSMAVQSSGENKFLTIQAGKVVWKYGTLETNPVIIDIEAVGMGSAKYLLAYQLYYDDSPQEFQYEVKDFLLVGNEMSVESNTDAVDGWRYTPNFAFVGQADRYWSNKDGMFPSYSQPASLSWQMPLESSYSKLTLRCPPRTNFTGTATLYYMGCTDVTPSTYCQSPEWNYGETVQVSKDQLGQYFEFNIDSPITTKGWKIEWSDPSISINNIYVDGIVTQFRKPATMTTNYALVAYPFNSVPTKFTNPSGEEIPLVLCKLAYVDIDSAFTVTKIEDIREVVYTPYEPIAEWLTRAWDQNLSNLYEQISNYPEYWMNPETCMYHEYSKLEEAGIVLDTSNCPPVVLKST